MTSLNDKLDRRDKITFLSGEFRNGVYRRIYSAGSESQARSFANLFSGEAIERSEIWFVYV